MIEEDDNTWVAGANMSTNKLRMMLTDIQARFNKITKADELEKLKHDDKTKKGTSETIATISTSTVRSKSQSPFRSPNTRLGAGCVTAMKNTKKRTPSEHIEKFRNHSKSPTRKSLTPTYRKESKEIKQSYAMVRTQNYPASTNQC